MSERYRLIRHLATGGMAEIYLGSAVGAEGFEKPVVFKRVLPHLANDAEVARLFLAEAQLARHLHHQNIVEIIDVGRAAGGLFIVMELVDGWELGEVLTALSSRAEKMPAHLAAFVAQQVMAGLCHAYRRTHQGKPILLAHRDVSPSNVLLSKEGEVKLTDFGIAKHVERHTEPGMFKGKLAYASPEQLAAEPPSHASDQFSLGVVLYEMLTGAHPFGQPSTLLGFVQRITQQEPAPLAGVPAPLVAIVSRLLAKKPADRFDAPESALRALSEFLARSGVPASSAELAAYLATLPLPPPFADRPGESVSASSFSLDPTGSPQSDDDDWQPSGPALDASGRLTGKKSPPRPIPLSEQAPGIAGPPMPEPSRAPRAHAPPLELAHPSRPPFEPPLDLSPPPRAPSEPALELARPVEASPAEPPLELSRSIEHPPADWVEPTRTRRAGRWVMALATLLVVGAFGGLHLWERLRSGVPIRLPGQSRAVLYIDSEPPGATVRINGRDIGTTPLVQDNVWPPNEIDFQLILKGYKPYAGTFRGGESVTVNAKLSKR